MSRGPLPASVYWRRRLVLLTIAGFVAIVGLKIVAHLGGGASSDPDAANLAGNTGQTTAPDVSLSDDPASTGPSVSTDPSESPLPEPSGDCDPADVVVEPAVGDVGSDGAISLTLNLHTMDAAACKWSVSDQTMQVKITSHGKQVWSTADCPRDMPDQDVVVYRDTTTPVPMLWSGRFSATDCASHQRWASYGDYRVTAAIFGGEPGDDRFSLVAPSAAKPSESPSSSASASAGATASTKPSTTASDKASTKPSGKPSTKH